MTLMTMLSSFIAGLPGMAFLAQADQTLWMPLQASDVAADVDWLFYMIYWISVFFFVLIVGLGTWFIIRYRGPREGEAQSSVHHNTPLEVTWTIIPLLIVIAIFWWGFSIYIDQETPPDNAMQIDVVGKQWNWSFRYPNNAYHNELHVPIDRDVVLSMRSEDVIHSFYVPEFRVKQDVVPGRYTKIWFRPVVEGRYKLLCAEYCGTEHSDMITDVVVEDLGSFQEYLATISDPFDGGKKPLHEVGETLYTQAGCPSCHLTTAEVKVGPGFANIWGKEEQFQDGSTAVVDENYIRESIEYPGAKRVLGFNNPMPSYKGRFSDQELDAIIEFIKSLSIDDYQPRTLNDLLGVEPAEGGIEGATDVSMEAGQTDSATAEGSQEKAEANQP